MEFAYDVFRGDYCPSDVVALGVRHDVRRKFSFVEEHRRLSIADDVGGEVTVDDRMS